MSGEDLRKKLASVPPEVLASFVARLADEDPAVRERAESLAVRADPEAHARALKKRLERFRRGRRFIKYAESGAFARQLEAWLDELQEALLPAKPEAAWALVDAFIRSDERIVGRVDDSNGSVGDAFRRACGLWHRTAAQLSPSPEWVERLHALHADNDYGVRDALLGEAGALLSELDLRRLAKTYEREVKAALASGDDDDFDSLSAAAAMGQVAEALRDAALYERSVRMRSPHPNSLQALEIARHYLAFGPVEKAVEWLGSGRGDSWRDLDRLELLAEAHEKLGDQAALLAVRRDLCERTLSSRTLGQYVALLPEGEREAAVGQAVERASASDESISGAMLLLDLDEPARAEDLIWRLRDRLVDAHYAHLRDLAKRFEKAGSAFGSVLCHRALVDQILAEGRSPAYRHAKRYVERLAALDERAGNYRGLPDHRGYLEQLRGYHGRKRKFWGLIDDE